MKKEISLHTMMDGNRRGLVKRLIEKRIDELQQLLAASGHNSREQAELLNDEATRLDTLANLSVGSRLYARASDDLARLQRRLAGVDEEGFGLCRDCGEEIPANRIASLPATELCIVCAQQQENNR